MTPDQLRDKTSFRRMEVFTPQKNMRICSSHTCANAPSAVKRDSIVGYQRYGGKCRVDPDCPQTSRKCTRQRTPHCSVPGRSEEHTSELQSLMRISYAVFCLKKKQNKHITRYHTYNQRTSKHT